MRALLNPIACTTASVLIFVLLPASAIAQKQIPVGAGANITITGPGGVEIGPDGINMGSLMGLFKRVDDDDASDNTLIKVSPTAIIVDTTTHTAVITLANLSSDTLNVTLALQDTRPPAKRDSSVAEHSLVSWMTGLPESIRLLPHATQQITLKATIPATAKPGIYTGWVVPMVSAPLASSDKDHPTSTTSSASVAKVMCEVK